MKEVDATMIAHCLSLSQLKDVFFTLRTNKNLVHEDIISNDIKNCFGELHKPKQYLLEMSLTVADSLKIARVRPLFKAGDPKILVIKGINWFSLVFQNYQSV